MARSLSRITARKKIFFIGFNKTGTTSIHRLFRSWGYRSFHGPYQTFLPGDSRFGLFDVFSDGERHDFDLLSSEFRASKFIVPLRRMDEWLASRIRHVEARQSRGLTGWMRREYEDDPDLAIQNWIIRRKEYYRSVAEFFASQPERLMLVNLVDGPANNIGIGRIAEFVGYKLRLPERLPHANNRQVRGSLHRSDQPNSRTKREVLNEVEQILENSRIPKNLWISDGREIFGEGNWSS
jgi:hypothetical protein